MEWEEQIEEKLDKNLTAFLSDKLSDIDCTKLMVHKSDKYMDMVDEMSRQIRQEIAEFIKVRTASIIDEKAGSLKSKARSLVK